MKKIIKFFIAIMVVWNSFGFIFGMQHSVCALIKKPSYDELKELLKKNKIACVQINDYIISVDSFWQASKREKLLLYNYLVDKQDLSIEFRNECIRKAFQKRGTIYRVVVEQKNNKFFDKFCAREIEIKYVHNSEFSCAKMDITSIIYYFARDFQKKKFVIHAQ